MKSGQFFNFPETESEHRKCWNEASPIDSDTCPNWIDDRDDWGTYRKLGFTSWETVLADDQPRYFEEMESAPDCIIFDSDDGDGCVHHIYVSIPDDYEPDHWTWKDKIDSLNDLIKSDEYQNSRFGSSSDDWLHDSERMQRVDEAAKNDCDGSTHGETIEDWRKCLCDCFEDSLTEQTREAIEAEIDACEAWHIENGTIDKQIG